jgi:DNA segregation ATPase FtsK/SpoIIIE, S-DNA-T family
MPARLAVGASDTLVRRGALARYSVAREVRSVWSESSRVFSSGVPGMIKHTMTVLAWAALSAAPTVVRAQTTTTPPTTVTPGTCDCPEGDSRGDLRNLAAFAPLGLLGALAAAGGAPALFAGTAATPVSTVATAAPSTVPTDPALPRSDGARNPSPDAPTTDAAPSLNRGRVPDPVSPDSLRAGLRAPNTGTELPSVFLLGTGLIAFGCVTVLRTRS